MTAFIQEVVELHPAKNPGGKTWYDSCALSEISYLNPYENGGWVGVPIRSKFVHPFGVGQGP